MSLFVDLLISPEPSVDSETVPVVLHVPLEVVGLVGRARHPAGESRHNFRRKLRQQVRGDHWGGLVAGEVEDTVRRDLIFGTQLLSKPLSRFLTWKRTRGEPRESSHMKPYDSL